MEPAKEPTEITRIMDKIVKYINDNIRRRYCRRCYQPVGQHASCEDLAWRFGYAGGPVFWFFKITAHGGKIWTAYYNGTDFIGFLRAVLTDLETHKWEKSNFTYL